MLRQFWTTACLEVINLLFDNKADAKGEHLSIQFLFHIVYCSRQKSEPHRDAQLSLPAIRIVGSELRFCSDRAANKFTNNKRMYNHFVVIKPGFQLGIPVSEMINPNRGINEYHATPVGRLLGIGDSFFSVPPRSANRLRFPSR